MHGLFPELVDKSEMLNCACTVYNECELLVYLASFSGNQAIIIIIIIMIMCTCYVLVHVSLTALGVLCCFALS